jgi:TIGR03009 family protein
MRRISWLMVVSLCTVSCTSAPAVKLPPPFKLTLDEEKNVDRLLARWEQWNAGIKTFDCRFKRWVADMGFGRPDEARYVEIGVLEYVAPDRLLFHVDTAEENGKEVPIEDRRAEHWAFDGTALIEYSHVERQVFEHKLPPNLQGKRLVDGPLTFPTFSTGLFWLGLAPPESGIPAPFSAKASDLKEQYYLRDVTPASEHDRIWLEAYPRTSRLAADFHRLQLMFRASDMSPVAMKVIQPNGKDYRVYQFFDIVVNGPPSSPGADPFHATVPDGWQKTVEEPPAARSSRSPSPGQHPR